ncbi:MAG: DNA replication and repair protein RecF [Microgenomates bacterium 39_7]|nr:MAG: DNA replication and repair protein RecF [Microgenomates bacterium 39_7]
MFLYKLLIQDFRLFSQYIIEFEEQTSVVVAPNAGGKSTILEAIYLLASGQSFRADKVEEMIAFRADIAQVKAKILSQLPNRLAKSEELEGLDLLQLGVLLTKGQVNGKRTKKQHYSINDNKRRKQDFVGNLLAVVFRPEDMRLIEGSPSRRRDYLNSSLLLVDREYQSALKQYEQILRRRNRILFAIREGEQSPQALTYWDMGLVKHGEKLQEKRRKLSEFINSVVDSPLEFRFEYLPSVITKDKLEARRQSEIGAGFTLIGPHKDDFEVQINLGEKADGSNFVSLDVFGSRGQKRMGVLWLKKAELAFLKHKTNKLPLLLLDDILSELDDENRLKVLQLVDGEQTIITTADEDLVKEIKDHFSSLQIIRLEANSG